MSDKKAAKFPMYKGKPLVRCGDTIYYGSMKDKYVIKMEIKSKKKVQDLEVADKVTVQLMYTDATIRNRKQIVKSSEKTACIWHWILQMPGFPGHFLKKPESF